jgi:hypothetical protein
MFWHFSLAAPVAINLNSLAMRIALLRGDLENSAMIYPRDQSRPKLKFRCDPSRRRMWRKMRPIISKSMCDTLQVRCLRNGSVSSEVATRRNHK